MSRNIAVILAGGSGSRLGGELPKQFLKVAGKRIIEHTIDVFEKSVLIDEICVVIREDIKNELDSIIIANQYKKVKKVLIGGKERYHSSLAAINAYNDDDNILFHDAVRPFVNNRIISDCIEALSQYNAIDVAIPTTDTIIAVDGENCIDSIPDRSVLRNGQTPQCFKLSVIKHAYEEALKDPNFRTTDDCGVVRKYMPNEPIYVVKGEQFNMKLTYIEDLFLLDKLFQLRSLQSTDTMLSADAITSLKDNVVVVFGGSYGIGGEIMNIANHAQAKFYSFSRSQNGVDVSKYDSVASALATVYEKEGRIDAVINTAGVLYRESLVSMTDQSINDSINVNLLGVINVARASFEYLKQSKGSLLFYTSSSYTRGRMMYSIYSATKASIVNFMQALAEEWYSFGIKVNAINPERTNTPMRTKNFGNEPISTLLDPKYVAIASINTIFSEFTGEVIDVRRSSNHA